ncbi:histidine--tRNA ligase [Campylobacter sp. RM16187]|uniref:histidine--tRNA ligase n=1 Tax=Campylobacter sp. RM16187 TaxID=1660063 RepID=UPI0021B6354B|nr:histidine--tRNA ligase [Campylobacter sp. RM16187]QKG29332.1 histidyl-tRNA synthetase [Campylobacter sp. RM16187]
MISALRGMKDHLPPSGQTYEYIIKICEEVTKNYGYSFIMTPHLEQTALFRRSVGESSDIVGKEMYQFIDKGENDVCLRPEGTAGTVRAFIEAKLDRAGGVRRYFYHGSMFRYERPQKGRLREFHQFGCECFGEASVYEDASVILMINEIFTKLNIKTSLKINSLGDSSCMPAYREKLLKFLSSHEALICEDCKRRKDTNPIRVLDCKEQKCQEIYKDAPLIIDNLSAECKADFDKLQEILTANGIKFEIDSRLVRGLDYYCKTAFEFISDEIGSQSAVAGGGRYDKLVEYLGGKASYGVGFAMGIERIMEILSTREASAKREGVYICALDEMGVDHIYNLGTNLRKKYKTEISYEARNLQKHLKNADNKNCEIFLCVGENELKEGKIWYKNLSTKDERVLNLDELQGVLGE